MAARYFSALAPRMTAKAVETTNALAAAIKTSALLDVPSVENSTVAARGAPDLGAALETDR